MNWLFRVAKPASFARNYAKTLSQTALFWGFFLGLLPAVVSAIENAVGLPQFEPRRALAGVVFVAFGSLGLTSGFFMARAGEGTPLPLDAPRRLVVVGPYRHIRNPMAVAGLIQGLATGVWFGSPAVMAYVVVGGVFWDRVIRVLEEDDLEARFGAEFVAYRDAVPCWRFRWSAYPRQA